MTRKSASGVVLEGTSCAESDFIFQDGVFYAIYGGHQHPRMPASELYEQLNPVSSLPRPSYSKCPPHFYSAQLLHYGSNAVKSKPQAKKKLLRMFSAHGVTLPVPKSILELEEVLRQRSQAEPKVTPMKTMNGIDGQHNNAASSNFEDFHSFTASAVTIANETEQVSNKEILSAAPTRTLTDIEVPPANATQRTFQTKTAGKTIWHTGNDAVSASGSILEKQTSGKIAHTSSYNSLSQNVTLTSKQTAGKTIWPGYKSTEMVSTETSAEVEVQTTPAPSELKRKHGYLSSVSLSSDRLEPRMAVKRFKKSMAPSPMTDGEIRVGIQEFSAVRAREILERLFDEIPEVVGILEHEISSEKERNQSSRVQQKPIKPSRWCGIYDVEALLVNENQAKAHQFTIEILQSSTSKHLWASFDFGTFQGIMRSFDEAPKFLDTEVRFQWRGDMEGRGTTFDVKNRVTMTFLPGGLFEGKMRAPAYGTYRIYGCRPAQPSKCLSTKRRLKKIKTWKSIWRQTNGRNFDICAEHNRWYGGSVVEEGMLESDDPYASDTTAGDEENILTLDSQGNFMDDPESSECESSVLDDTKEDES